MSFGFPGRDIAQKFKSKISADNTGLVSTITVAADEYAVIYRLWVFLDVDGETDIENLIGAMTIRAVMGSLLWAVIVHPFNEHRNAAEAYIRTIDLGPWFFDFGPEGLYSGVKGDDLVVDVVAAGTGIKATAAYMYSGD